MLTEMRGTAQQTVQHMGSRLSCAPVISNSLRRDADDLVHDTLERALTKSALRLGVLERVHDLSFCTENSAMRNRYASDVSQEKFEEIRPLLQSVRRRTKPPTVDLYEVFCAGALQGLAGQPYAALPEQAVAQLTIGCGVGGVQVGGVAERYTGLCHVVGLQGGQDGVQRSFLLTRAFS